MGPSCQGTTRSVNAKRKTRRQPAKRPYHPRPASVPFGHRRDVAQNRYPRAAFWSVAIGRKLAVFSPRVPMGERRGPRRCPSWLGALHVNARGRTRRQDYDWPSHPKILQMSAWSNESLWRGPQFAVSALIVQLPRRFVRLLPRTRFRDNFRIADHPGVIARIRSNPI